MLAYKAVVAYVAADDLLLGTKGVDPDASGSNLVAAFSFSAGMLFSDALPRISSGRPGRFQNSSFSSPLSIPVNQYVFIRPLPCEEIKINGYTSGTNYVSPAIVNSKWEEFVLQRANSFF